MNWDAIGAFGELFGGVIVIASVIYLARQIRESNWQAQAQSERELGDKWQRILDATFREPNTRAITVKGLGSFSALTDDEKVVFLMFIIGITETLDVMLTNYKKGLISEEVVTMFQSVALAFIATPGGREFWNMGFRGFGSEAVRVISENIDNPEIVPVTESLPFFLNRQ